MGLLPGEKLLASRRQSRSLLYAALVAPVLLLASSIVAAIILRDRQFLLYGFLLFGALLLLSSVKTVLNWYSNRFEVTDQRVILEIGIFSRKTTVIPLERIQNITSRQTFLGRLLGYGTVEIDAASRNGIEILDYLQQPEQFRDLIFQEVELRRHENQGDQV